MSTPTLLSRHRPARLHFWCAASPPAAIVVAAAVAVVISVVVSLTPKGPLRIFLTKNSHLLSGKYKPQHPDHPNASDYDHLKVSEFAFFSFLFCRLIHASFNFSSSSLLLSFSHTNFFQIVRTRLYIYCTSTEHNCLIVIEKKKYKIYNCAPAQHV